MMWTGVAVLGFGVITAGCVKDDLVQCAGGRVCPAGTTCDDANQTCIDPLGLSLPSGAIDFATVACGATAELVVPVRNFGVSPIEYSATSTINGIDVSPATGSVDPGGVATLTVSARPGAGSIPGVPVEGSLVLSTSSELVERPIRMIVGGAQVMASPTVDFGETPTVGMAFASLVVRNEGTSRADVTMAPLSPPFAATSLGPFPIDPEGVQTISLGFVSPGVINKYSQAVALTFTGDHCQPPPSTVGLVASVSGDAVLANPTALDFGPTLCSADAQNLTVQLTNQSVTEQSITASITGGAAWTTPQSDATLPSAPGMIGVTVTRKATLVREAVGAKTGTLTLTATPSGTTKVIGLSYEIRAPVLTVAPEMSSFLGGSGTRAATVTNSGNATAAVTIVPSEYTFGSGGRMTVSPSSFFVPAGGSTPVSLTYQQGLISAGTVVAFRVESTGQCSPVPVMTVQIGAGPMSMP